MPTARVLHLITESNLGGAQRNTLETVRRLPKDGYVPILAAGPDGPGDAGALMRAAADADLETHTIDSLRRSISPLADLEAYRCIRKLIRDLKPAIVHTHSTKAGILGRLAARAEKTPAVVHTIHGTPFHDRVGKLRHLLYAACERHAAKATDVLLAVAEAVKSEFVVAGVAPAEKIEVVYSGVDFEQLHPGGPRQHTREKLGIKDSEVLVIAVGALRECKGHRHLIKAAARLGSGGDSKYRFAIAGEGELRTQLERAIREQELQDRLHLLGERSDVADILEAGDIYVQPSLWEGLGRALTEAMYARKPVVASAINAIPELVEDGVTGLLVPAGSSQELAAAISRLADDRDLAARLGESAKRRVEVSMSVTTMIERICEIYRRVLGEGPSR